MPPARILQELRANSAPVLRAWQPIFETESLLRAGRTREARARLDARWPADNSAFCLYYRVSTLSELRDTYAALDLLGQYPNLLDAEATLTLRLDALAAGGMRRPLKQEIDRLLAVPLTPSNLPVVKILCAHLIRFPDPDAFGRLSDKVVRDETPLQSDSAGIWFSLFCTAGTVGDRVRLHEYTARLRNASQRPFMALSAVEAFFRGETAERRFLLYLPLLPLPLEVTYALLERYPPLVTAVTAQKNP